MKPENEALIQKQLEILSFRDLADGTVNTFISYLTQFIDWTEHDLKKMFRMFPGPRSVLMWIICVVITKSLTPMSGYMSDVGFF